TLDTTVFTAQWNSDKASEYFDLPIFTIGDKSVTVKDFAEHFETKQLKRKPIDYSILVGPIYSSFEENQVLGYEENRLEEKYPEFKNIVQEYHDGILLFDLTDEMVWSKAVEDTAGLESYYEEHKNNYMWENRALTYNIIIKDSTIAKNVIKRTRKLARRNRFDKEKLMEKFCAEDTTGNCLEITENKYEKGDNEKVDEMKWEEGSIKLYTHNGDQAITLIKEILDPTVKKLDETRGLVIADYQKFLEEKWLSELRNTSRLTGSFYQK
ncbi:MAG: hypothetical protein ACP5E3_16855, partial [Bacteroidales bacterium]